MATIKSEDHFVNDYFIGEGNKIGALPAEFGENQENFLDFCGFGAFLGGVFLRCLR